MTDEDGRPTWPLLSPAPKPSGILKDTLGKDVWAAFRLSAADPLITGDVPGKAPKGSGIAFGCAAGGPAEIEEGALGSDVRALSRLKAPAS